MLELHVNVPEAGVCENSFNASGFGFIQPTTTGIFA
jgi:hypothetical protein